MAKRISERHLSVPSTSRGGIGGSANRCARAQRLGVAESERQRVRSVVRGKVAHAREQRNHPGDLFLARPAMPGDRLFYFGGGVLVDLESRLGGGEQYDSPDLAELDRGHGVAGEKNPLQGEGTRTMLVDQAGNSVVDLLETLLGGIVARDVTPAHHESAMRHVPDRRRRPAKIKLDAAVSQEAGAGVDTQDADEIRDG